MIFIGATTENPSFELNGALLSRARVYRLRPMSEEAIEAVLAHALANDEPLRARALAVDALELGRIARARRRRCAPRAQPAGDRGGPRRRRGDRRRGAARGAGRRSAPLRQGRRHLLRPDLGAAQGGARRFARTRRCTGWRACSTAAATRSTSRGAWCAWPPRTSATPIRAASPGAGGLGHAGAPRQPRGRARDRAGAGLSRLRAEEQRGVHGLRRGARRRARAAEPRGAAAPAQRADAADEGDWASAGSTATPTTRKTPTRRARTTFRPSSRHGATTTRCRGDWRSRSPTSWTASARATPRARASAIRARAARARPEGAR